MSDMNKVQLIGRLGQDPELRYTSNGTPVCNLRIATNSFYNNKQQTEWHRVVVWRKVAVACGENLSKGRQVYIEGSLQTRKWKDKEGQTRYTTEIQGRFVNFLGANPNKKTESTQSAEEAPTAEVTPEETEEAMEVFSS